jgi:hypothetical protein
MKANFDTRFPTYLSVELEVDIRYLPDARLGGHSLINCLLSIRGEVISTAKIIRANQISPLLSLVPFPPPNPIPSPTFRRSFDSTMAPNYPQDPFNQPGGYAAQPTPGQGTQGGGQYYDPANNVGGMGPGGGVGAGGEGEINERYEGGGMGRETWASESGWSDYSTFLKGERMLRSMANDGGAAGFGGFFLFLFLCFGRFSFSW